MNWPKVGELVRGRCITMYTEHAGEVIERREVVEVMAKKTLTVIRDQKTGREIILWPGTEAGA